MSDRRLTVILETPREWLRDHIYGNRFRGFATFVAVCMSSRTVKWSHFGDAGTIRVRVRLRRVNMHEVAGVTVRGR